MVLEHSEVCSSSAGQFSQMSVWCWHVIPIDDVLVMVKPYKPIGKEEQEDLVKAYKEA